MMLFCDGCDSYAATADLTRKWASDSAPSAITFSAAGSKWGGGCISLSNAAAGNLISPNFGTAGAGAGGKVPAAAFWFKCSGAPILTYVLMTCSTISGTAVLTLQMMLTGLLRLASGSGSLTGTKNVCDGQWHWIEFKADCTTSTIPARLVIDGFNDINGSITLGTVPTDLGNVQISSTTNQSATVFIDDLIFYDDETGSQTGELISTSAFPLGAKRIETLRPTGAGTNTNWTPDSGSNYARVNETAPDGDTSYVASAASGIRDSYATGDMIGTTPLCTVVNLYARNSDVGNISLQGLTYSGSSYGLGDGKSLGNAYVTRQFPIYRDPNTSAAWTVAGINAAEFGQGVV
jgi:hypothetical protein